MRYFETAKPHLGSSRQSKMRLNYFNLTLRRHSATTQNYNTLCKVATILLRYTRYAGPQRRKVYVLLAYLRKKFSFLRVTVDQNDTEKPWETHTGSIWKEESTDRLYPRFAYSVQTKENVYMSTSFRMPIASEKTFINLRVAWRTKNACSPLNHLALCSHTYSE